MSPIEQAHEDLMEALREWRKEVPWIGPQPPQEKRLAAAWDAYEKEMEGRP